MNREMSPQWDTPPKDFEGIYCRGGGASVNITVNLIVQLNSAAAPLEQQLEQQFARVPWLRKLLEGVSNHATINRHLPALQSEDRRR